MNTIILPETLARAQIERAQELAQQAANNFKAGHEVIAGCQWRLATRLMAEARKGVRA